MQPTNSQRHSVHWSVEYFIYMPWSSTCVLVVEELSQPLSGRLLLLLQHFMDCLTLFHLMLLSPSQQWWFEIKTIVCTQYFTRVSAARRPRPLSIDAHPGAAAAGPGSSGRARQFQAKPSLTKGCLATQRQYSGCLGDCSAGPCPAVAAGPIICKEWNWLI